MAYIPTTRDASLLDNVLNITSLLITTMSSNDTLLKEAESVAVTNPQRAEQIYKQILGPASASVSSRTAPRDHIFRSINAQWNIFHR